MKSRNQGNQSMNADGYAFPDDDDEDVAPAFHPQPLPDEDEED